MKAYSRAWLSHQVSDCGKQLIVPLLAVSNCQSPPQIRVWFHSYLPTSCCLLFINSRISRFQLFNKHWSFEQLHTQGTLLRKFTEWPLVVLENWIRIIRSITVSCVNSQAIPGRLSLSYWCKEKPPVNILCASCRIWISGAKRFPLIIFNNVWLNYHYHINENYIIISVILFIS